MPDAAPDAPPPIDLVAAAALYEAKACIACHTIDGTVKIGKSSKGIFGSKVALTDGSEVVVDEAFIRESLLEPNAKVSAGFPPSMPSYKGVLTDGEIDMLIAYIKSLK